MSEEQAKRKLAAILSADVKGYSRLMEDNEEATVQTITAYRELIVSRIQNQNGRVVDAKGDSLLAEFSSVVDAIRCAVEIQKEVGERNAELPEHRKMQFRIGVNLGDVIEEDESIYGDGVNIAARLEALSEGGGICISGTAFDQIGKKLSLGYEYLGEQTVRNIEKPVRAYKVLMEPEAVGKVIGEDRPRLRRWRWSAIAAIATLVLVAGALTIWNFYLAPPSVEPASLERMAHPLPDKPSIAVLPFVNISGDPEQEYFCDGLTDEIITSLSMIPRLFVIARNSTFTYKGKPVKVQQVSEELGVRYVLEGSVRKSRDRVRITAQLIDALTGKHLWAERYEQDLKETFALQDAITVKVVNAMQVELTEGEGARLRSKITPPLDLYLKYWQAVGYLRRFNKEDNIRARQLIEEFNGQVPDSPYGWAVLAWIHLDELMLGLSKSPRESLAQATKMAKKAIELGYSGAEPHMILAHVYRAKRQHEEAIAEAELALTLEPNSADAHETLGTMLMFAGRHEEAIPFLKKALRLNPFPSHHAHSILCAAYRCLGRYEEAVAECEKALQLQPDSALRHLAVASAYSMAGRDEKARAAVQEALKLDPTMSLEFIAKVIPFKRKADLERLLNALRRAGLK